MGVLQGRVAVITGGGRGIGRAIAEAMAQAGAAVHVSDRNEAEAKEAAAAIMKAGGKATGYGLDVTDAKACAALAKTVSASGPASILVNNAGVIFPGLISDDSGPANWAKTLDVNVNGAFNMAHALQSQLFATKGAVINLASIRSFTSAGNAAAYSTSKGAVMQFTKALAVEWGPHGVRVNAIAPGFIDTAFVPDAEKTPQREAAIIARTPLKRQGVPAEIGPVAVFLVSDAASYVSGVILPVDGGYLAA
jgi:NAD(P)-dependent dehydrogenase (short-subunit alcohol dehydrogenase family)